MTKIIAVGDIMPGGLLNKTKHQFLSDGIKEVLHSGDIRIGTLETAIGNEPAFYDEKMKRHRDVIYAEDQDLLRLKEMNIDVLSLANNHFFDLGPSGAAHTIDLLDKLRILHCGAGRNIEEAQKPAVVYHEGKSYAFLGFCDNQPNTTGWCPIATSEKPGINPLYENHVCQQIRNNKERYDFVIVLPHWGIEHTVHTTSSMYSLGRKMISAGADAVLGSHPHHVQPVEYYHKSTIAYSMGNFLFPDRLITTPRSTYYPVEPIDIHQLPVSYSYPYNVKEPTLKIWKSEARIGMMLSLTIGQKAKCHFTQLNQKQTVDLFNNSHSLSFKLHFLSFLMSTNLYTIYYFFYKCFRRLYLNIKKK